MSSSTSKSQCMYRIAQVGIPNALYLYLTLLLSARQAWFFCAFLQNKTRRKIFLRLLLFIIYILYLYYIRYIASFFYTSCEFLLFQLRVSFILHTCFFYICYEFLLRKILLFAVKQTRNCRQKISQFASNNLVIHLKFLFPALFVKQTRSFNPNGSGRGVVPPLVFLRLFKSKKLVVHSAASTIHIWPSEPYFFNVLVKQTRNSGYGWS